MLASIVTTSDLNQTKLRSTQRRRQTSSSTKYPKIKPFASTSLHTMSLVFFSLSNIVLFKHDPEKYP